MPMSYREALHIMKNRVSRLLEKADPVGYKWQRKDGSWWTNHAGQVVPYHEPTHGNRDDHPKASEVSNLHDELESYHFHDTAAKHVNPRSKGFSGPAEALKLVRDHTEKRNIYGSRIARLREELGESFSDVEHTAMSDHAKKNAKQQFRDAESQEREAYHADPRYPSNIVRRVPKGKSRYQLR